MGFFRGRVYRDREVVPRVVVVNGPLPFRQCECGKWLSNKTGEHIEVKEVSFSELVNEYGQRCPDEKD